MSEILSELNIQHRVSLKPWNSFRVGGEAKYFVEVTTCFQLQSVFLWCTSENIPFFILGKGSNALFNDEGFDGLVICNRIDFLRDLGQGFMEVGAGYSFARLGTYTARKGWSGLEFAAGIPATVGGAVFMNAGANGMETAGALHSVHYLHANGKEEIFERQELHFSYRTSPFQSMQGAIVQANFRLTPSDDAKVAQRKLLDYRLQTQPYSQPSAGCVFRNPTPEIAAAELIDRCGLKGVRVGDAQVSPLHANFIVNVGEATAGDIRALYQLVQAQVLKKEGIALEYELRDLKEL